jgi:hypothetical protein
MPPEYFANKKICFSWATSGSTYFRIMWKWRCAVGGDSRGSGWEGRRIGRFELGWMCFSRLSFSDRAGKYFVILPYSN